MEQGKFPLPLRTPRPLSTTERTNGLHRGVGCNKPASLCLRLEYGV